MSRRFSVALVVSVLGMALSKAQAQPAPATQFPLAAPAGKDSGAIDQAPARRRESGALRRRQMEIRTAPSTPRRIPKSGIR